MSRWFLGGTCAGTQWRNNLIPYLKRNNIDFFNPVVDDWTPECQAIEEDEKNNKCDVHLYVLTPEMQGTYSIAEIVHSAHLANMYGTSVSKVIVAVMYPDRWEKHQIKSFDAMFKLVKNIARENAAVGFINDEKDILIL
jgi:hypothetical protein